MSERLHEPIGTTTENQTLLTEEPGPTLAQDTGLLIDRLLSAMDHDPLSSEATMLLTGKRLLRFAGKKYAGYDLSREFILSALLISQELRAPFVNLIACHCEPTDETDIGKWLQFRKALHSKVISAAKV